MPLNDQDTLLRAYRELAKAAVGERDRLRTSKAKLRAVLDQVLTQLIDNDTADTDDLISVGNAIRGALADAQHPEQQPAQPSMVEGDTLPIVLWQFEQRANVLLSNEQEKASPDNALIGFICDAVRLARENVRQQPDSDARDEVAK